MGMTSGKKEDKDNGDDDGEGFGLREQRGGGG